MNPDACTSVTQILTLLARKKPGAWTAIFGSDLGGTTALATGYDPHGTPAPQVEALTRAIAIERMVQQN
jgi:hypothetical protein